MKPTLHGYGEDFTEITKDWSTVLLDRRLVVTPIHIATSYLYVAVGMHRNDNFGIDVIALPYHDAEGWRSKLIAALREAKFDVTDTCNDEQAARKMQEHWPCERTDALVSEIERAGATMQ